jgi:kynurenine formamidase
MNKPSDQHTPHPAHRGRIVDLSLTIDDRMRGVQVEPKRRLADHGWNATTLSLYSHSGTHMDAPAHFLPGGATLDEQDLSVCIGPARVIDLTPIEPRALITSDSLGKHAGNVQPGDRLLLRTDWYHHHGTPEYRDQLPRISAQLAQWLVDRQVSLLGVEPPSVADVNNLEELTEVHHILMRGNVLIVEGLAHLDQLTTERVDFIALPLKVRDGDGSPIRAIAVERVADD